MNRQGYYPMTWRIGVDIGGTFTDVAVVDDTSDRIGAAKTLTTPRDIVTGVLEEPPARGACYKGLMPWARFAWSG
jgi:hypothetical protein